MDYFEKIWEDRYQKNNETYTEQLHRVAKFVAKNDREYESAFFDLMNRGLFFPAGRTMSNAGIGNKLTLNNCFVAPVIQDSMEDIFDSVKLGAITHKAGGGIGYSFSNLSPRGTKTHNDAIASGAVSFMDVFNAQTATVQQGSRRGANMGVMSIYHPDILEFIDAKRMDKNRLNHFNLSVMVDDAFMTAVENDSSIKLHFPIYDERGNKLSEDKWIDSYTREVDAKALWEIIMRCAYENGEPGVLFEDTLNRNNPANYLENIVCSNPCGEYLAGTIKREDCNPSDYAGACNLGSLFLHNFVKNPFQDNAYIDGEGLEHAAKTAVRFLDDIIDVNYFPNKAYKEYQENMRTIGIGITGFADTLAMLGMSYDSEEALKFADRLIKQLTIWEYEASIDLAEEKGCFPFCDKELHANSNYCQNSLPERLIRRIKRVGIRNAKIQSIAPTGTISIAFGHSCSSGIEPIFQLEYDRKVKIGGQEEINTEIVHVVDNAYHLCELYNNKKLNDSSLWKTALDIPVEAHVNMLSVFAKYTDMSISKTINVPESYSFDDTKNIYMKCWKNGVKGCTIFRPNSLREGVLLTSKPDKVAEEQPLKWGDVLSTNEDLFGNKRKLVTGCGKFHLQLYFDPENGEPRETFINMGRGGGCERNLNFISKLMSLCLRAGVPIEEIIDTGKNIRPCRSFCDKDGTSRGTSCPSAIAYALEDLVNKFDGSFIIKDKAVNKIEENKLLNDEVAYCPECGSEMPKGGCSTCPNCGWQGCL